MLKGCSTLPSTSLSVSCISTFLVTCCYAVLLAALALLCVAIFPLMPMLLFQAFATHTLSYAAAERPTLMSVLPPAVGLCQA